jgi:hypothetical protein
MSPAFIKLKELIGNGNLEGFIIPIPPVGFGKSAGKKDILWSFAPHVISMILTLVTGRAGICQSTGGHPQTMVALAPIVAPSLQSSALIRPECLSADGIIGAGSVVT